MIPIVITSINRPTKAVKQLAKLGQVIVAGDNKSPKNWELKGAVFLSIEDQHYRYKKFSRLVAEDHYARKNLAYLEAIKYDYIYETDDDNFPYSSFRFYTKKLTGIEIGGNQILNIYSLFTRKKIWPRGLPLTKIQSKARLFKKKAVEPVLVQSLADRDTDVDAIFRLTIGSEVKFAKNKAFVVKKRCYTPCNSQNTLWKKEIFPLLYLPSTVNQRVCDIWRGYIAQRLLWKINQQLVFTSPTVYQVRNPHNLMKDFNDEIDLYTKTEKLIKSLDLISLSGDVKTMLYQVYKNLIELGFFKKSELDILYHWLLFFD